MPLPPTGIFLDMLAIVGIGIEAGGFVVLLKYLRSPTWTEHKKWIDSVPDEKKTQEFWQNTTVYHDVRKITKEENMMADNVNVGFLEHWQKRRRFGIFMVIFGLVCQIFQLGIPHL